MSEQIETDTSFVIGHAEAFEETVSEMRTRRGRKLLTLVEDLVPEGVAVAICRNTATFRANRGGRVYELTVESAPGTHVLDCDMAAVSLHAAADACRRFVAGET